MLEINTFDELVCLIALKTGIGAKMIHAKPQLALFLARLIGYRINDAVITKDEINGLYESPHFRRLTHGTHAPNRVVGGKR